jgi:hypothetical protein
MFSFDLRADFGEECVPQIIYNPTKTLQYNKKIL